ncbi:MAG TPA: hypothetical protein VI893_02435 [Thermoplasmata archaeon]|nr:hypothetical protein [Thermoplasmata archaeon]
MRVTKAPGTEAGPGGVVSGARFEPFDLSSFSRPRPASRQALLEAILRGEVVR